MNIVDHFATFEYIAGKPWILTFMWMPNGTNNLAVSFL